MTRVVCAEREVERGEAKRGDDDVKRRKMGKLDVERGKRQQRRRDQTGERAEEPPPNEIDQQNREEVENGRNRAPGFVECAVRVFAEQIGDSLLEEKRERAIDEGGEVSVVRVERRLRAVEVPPT